MKVVSIIGTRPQYIKIKPLYDYFRSQNIQHVIIDTLQHYSDSVSKNIIDDLNLKIDHQVEVRPTTEFGFIAHTTVRLEKLLLREKPNVVLVFGDTNSSFCASLFEP